MMAKETVIKTTVVEPKEKWIAMGNIIVTRPNKEKINPYYLKVFLDSEKSRKILKLVQTDTSIISISTRALKNMVISAPSMTHQKK